MPKDHEFAHKPPITTHNHPPEFARRLGRRDGDAVEREMEGMWKGANRKIGTMVAKTMNVGGKGQR